MASILKADIDSYLSDVQIITYSVSVALHKLASENKDPDLCAQLRTCAAASEVSADKAAIIREIMP